MTQAEQAGEEATQEPTAAAEPDHTEALAGSELGTNGQASADAAAANPDPAEAAEAAEAALAANAA